MNALTRAADWLEAHDWIQDEYGRDANGTVLTHTEMRRGTAVCACAIGAIHAGTPTNRAEIVRALIHLEEHLGRDVPYWNDARGRTKEEVIAALRTAAASL